MNSKDLAEMLIKRALDAEIGIAIKPEDQRGFAISMNHILKKHKDRSRIAIMTPINGEVWFVKKSVELP